MNIGPFELDFVRQQLTRDGTPVRLGNRALTLLIALVEARGELVGKDDLIARVWPDTFVEEANLRVHVATLRKVLGDTGDPPQFIANVSGRGYRFVAPITTADGAIAAEGPRAPHDGDTAPLTRIIGRTEEVATLLERATLRRLITVSGPGGIGKTTVAFAVARKLSEAFDDGIVAVDLGAAAADEHSLPQALAMALKVSAPSGNAVPSLVSYLAGKHLLLLLDNCEHIIDAVTGLAEELLRGAPGLHILATSTEPMRAEGEWIFRLLPLEIPSEAENLTAEEALQVPAIELFVERAAASSETFQFTDADVPLVSEICRRLDGNPLAIEIAAASLEAFGLRDLAAHLDDRFEVLVRGRRTSPPRQQTLRNLLDWSHSTLSPSEQATLRRLAIFRGAFTLDGVRAIAGLDGSGPTVIGDVGALVRKSLVTANTGEAQTTYRLLDSTRAYARDRATDAGELDTLSQRHADYFEARLSRAELDWTSVDRAEWLELHGMIIDDARAATDWAFSPNGNIGQGIRLTSLLLPLGFQFALIDEMADRITVALTRAHEASPREYVAEIRLNVAHTSLGLNRDADIPEEDPYLRQALDLARESGNPVNSVGGLMKLAIHYLNVGGYAKGLSLADEAYAAMGDSKDDLARLGIERVLAQSADMAGEHQRARHFATRVMRHPARNVPLMFGSMQTDRQISMRVVLARSLWIEGFASQAKAAALEAVRLAHNDGPSSIGLALGLGACPVALWSGLDEEAEGLTRELLEKSERFSLGVWHLWGQLFDMVLAHRRGDEPAPVAPSIVLQSDTLVTLHPMFSDDASLARARANAAGWANPELLRAAGERMLRSTRPDRVAEALVLLNESLEQARSRGALAWELRTATTIAGAHYLVGNGAKGRAVLEPVYERLVEGHGTADALRARDILEGRAAVSLLPPPPPP